MGKKVQQQQIYIFSPHVTAVCLHMFSHKTQRAGFPVLIELALHFNINAATLRNYNTIILREGCENPAYSLPPFTIFFFVLIVSRVFLLCLLFGVVYTQKQSRHLCIIGGQVRESVTIRMCWYANDLYTCSNARWKLLLCRVVREDF